MDWFEYDLKVTESGVTTTANNEGDIDPKRYYFVTGPYSSISALGGERHHFVSSSSLEYFYPAILIDKKHRADIPNH